MVGEAMPVTEAKKMAEISAGVRPSGVEREGDGGLAQLDGGADPLVVGLLEADELGIAFEREDGVAGVDAAVGVQAGEQPGLGQAVRPANDEGFGYFSLGVAIRRKSGAYRGNVHSFLEVLVLYLAAMRCDESRWRLSCVRRM